MASRPRSLRTRLVLAAVLGLAATLTIGAVVLDRAVVAARRDQVLRSISETADAVAAQLTSGVPVGDVARPPGVGPFAAPTVQIRDSDVTIIRTIDPFAGQTLREVVTRGSRPVPDLDVLTASHKWFSDRRYVTIPRGAVSVVVALPRELVDDAEGPLRRSLLFGTPLLVALAAIATWHLTGRALRPLDRLRNDIAALEAATLRGRVDVPDAGPELIGIASATNDLLERIERWQKDQRRFVADAAHELRTPLATLQTELEIACDHPQRTDWKQRAPGLLEDTRRLSNVVEGLLVLARVDETVYLPMTTFALDDLAREITAGMTGVGVRSADCVVIEANAQLLRQLIGNLIDNAQRHARTQVEIVLYEVPDFVLLRVDDDGPGIATSDRERVFQRFVRLDDSRSRAYGGAGIGLSLVHAIADAHGGDVTIGESSLGGASFIVRLARNRARGSAHAIT